MEWASKAWQKQLKLSAKNQPQRSAVMTFDIVLFNNLNGNRLTAKYKEHITPPIAKQG